MYRKSKSACRSLFSCGYFKSWQTSCRKENQTRSDQRTDGCFFGIFLLVLGTLMSPLSQPLSAEPIRWDKNGHNYEIVAVPDGITWSEARKAALARGGHLVTIQSQEEQDFVFQNLVNDPKYWRFGFAPPFENQAAGPWIGAFEPPNELVPEADWQWVNGDGRLDQTYSNWAPFAPNDYQGIKQDVALFYDNNINDPPSISPLWDDWQQENTAVSYIIEWDGGPPRTCFGQDPTIVGTEADDTLTGTPRDDVIMGLGGDDTIQGKGGNDLVCGGRGADIIKGGQGNDILSGGRGNDQMFGGAGIDVLLGERGADTLNGGDGIDIAVGGLGIDTCTAEYKFECE